MEDGLDLRVHVVTIDGVECRVVNDSQLLNKRSVHFDHVLIVKFCESCALFGTFRALEEEKGAISILSRDSRVARATCIATI